MDSLYDVLNTHEPDEAPRIVKDTSIDAYLARLSTLSLADLTNNEPASLSQSTQSHTRNLQALSKRSHRAVISSSEHLENLSIILPSVAKQSRNLRDNLPALESAATEFATKYERGTENSVLDKRKRALLLSRNVDRVSDVLDLPSLLASSVASAQAIGTSSTSNAAASYSAALDLSAHVKRLSTLYPQSSIVADISKQAESEVQNLRTILITSLQNPSLKLAAAIRIVGWLRRVAPELTDEKPQRQSLSAASQEFADGGLAALFLICRLRTLLKTLDALEPLRDLADMETQRRQQTTNGTVRKGTDSAPGSQSERFLKRYIEIFREQSFNIVSMYKSIFPAGLPQPDAQHEETDSVEPLLPLPSPIVSFTTHLVSLLGATLKQYMANVSDKSSRESLLTQVLYCAGSLGRQGADFGMLIAMFEEDIAAEDNVEPEWAQVMNKHRIQASRLEVLARGVGTTRKASGEIPMLSPMVA